MYSFNNSKKNKYVNDVKSGKIDFPYKRIYKTNSDIKKMFSNLKKVKFNKQSNRVIIDKHYRIKTLQYVENELLFLGNSHLLIHDSKDYDNFNILSDMFQEENRMKCTVIHQDKSPYQYFKTNINELTNKCLERYKIITPYNIREILYDSIKECTSFKPLNFMYIISLFKCKSALDFSAGWGDRLIGAIASNIRYVGVDPNPSLHPNYNKIIDFFCKQPSKKKYTMIQSTIASAKIPTEKFDIVFTSPPYFNLEMYTSHKNQSISMFPDEHGWFVGFLIPAIEKCIKFIKYDGYLVININQKKHDKYVNNMRAHINSIKCIHYLGVISYANADIKNPQPMWIWKKSKKQPLELYKNKKVVLKTKRLQLRHFQISDVNQMYNIMKNPINMKNIALGQIKSKTEVKKLITKYITDQYTFYPICLKTKIIGYIGYYSGKYLNIPFNLKYNYYLRIIIDEKYTKKGFGMEIMVSFINYILKKLKYREIYSLIEINNIPSIKLHNKLGFTKNNHIININNKRNILFKKEL
jgi:ribosomal-protein-alanine N-acetyltransferase